MSKRKIIIAVLLLMAIGAAVSFVAYVQTDYAAYRKNLVEYGGVRLGTSQRETIYVLGVPTHVTGNEQIDMDPKTMPPDMDSGPWHPVYQVDGKDTVNAMPEGTTFRTYNEWSYDIAKHSKSVHFNDDGRTVDEVSCREYLTAAKPECPSLFGVRRGMSEDEVMAKLGRPAKSGLDVTTKTLTYARIGTRYHLEKKRVVGMVKIAPIATFTDYLLGYN